MRVDGVLLVSLLLQETAESPQIFDGVEGMVDPVSGLFRQFQVKAVQHAQYTSITVMTDILHTHGGF